MSTSGLGCVGIQDMFRGVGCSELDASPNSVAPAAGAELATPVNVPKHAAPQSHQQSGSPPELPGSPPPLPLPPLPLPQQQVSGTPSVHSDGSRPHTPSHSDWHTPKQQPALDVWQTFGEDSKV